LINREISAYADYDAFLRLAHNPEMRFVFSNTTEAGISYHAGDRFDDAPPVSYPAKLTRLLFERYQHFAGAADKGWVIIPCELIDYNGEALQAWCCAMPPSGSCRRTLSTGSPRRTPSVPPWWIAL
jgi:tagaturonate reductase